MSYTFAMYLLDCAVDGDEVLTILDSIVDSQETETIL